MIGYLKLGAIGLAACAVIGTSTYFVGRSNGKAVVQAELDQQRVVWQTEHDEQVAETGRIQGEWDRITGERDGLQEQLTAAAARGATLADRLRQHASRRQCAVPATATLAAGTGEPSAQPSLDERIERTARRVSADCAADAEQLDLVLAKYEAVRAAQQASHNTDAPP